MTKFVAVLQLIGAAVSFVAAVATLVNLVLITTRPETISVVNALIGLGVLAICLLALSRVLLRKGLAGFRAGG